MLEMDPKARKSVGLVMTVSGLALAFAGLYLLTATEQTLVGAVLFAAGGLDLVIALFFLKG